MTPVTPWQNFLLKIGSGRWFLTVVTAISFLIIVVYLLVILKQKIADVDANQIILLVTNMALIIQNVFNSYFNKKRDENGNGNGTENGSSSTSG